MTTNGIRTGHLVHHRVILDGKSRMEYMLIGQQGWLMFGELPESLETMARILKNAYSSGELQDCIPLACIPVFMNTITEWSSTWYGYVVRNLLFNVRNYRV